MRRWCYGFGCQMPAHTNEGTTGGLDEEMAAYGGMVGLDYTRTQRVGEKHTAVGRAVNDNGG